MSAIFRLRSAADQRPASKSVIAGLVELAALGVHANLLLVLLLHRGLGLGLGGLGEAQLLGALRAGDVREVLAALRVVAQHVVGLGDALVELVHPLLQLLVRRWKKRSGW